MNDHILAIRLAKITRAVPAPFLVFSAIFEQVSSVLVLDELDFLPKISSEVSVHEIQTWPRKWESDPGKDQIQGPGRGQWASTCLDCFADDTASGCGHTSRGSGAELPIVAFQAQARWARRQGRQRHSEAPPSHA